METVIQAVIVMAAFAAVYERSLEMVRGLRAHVRVPWLQRVLDSLTIGSLNMVPAIFLATVTRASLLDLFVRQGEQVRFFSVYMQPAGEAWFGDLALRDWFGFVLMGFGATLGSQFWHDFGKGLVDLRNRMKELPAAAQLPAAVSPSSPQGPQGPRVIEGGQPG